jgi:hypothetical protein
MRLAGPTSSMGLEVVQGDADQYGIRLSAKKVLLRKR